MAGRAPDTLAPAPTWHARAACLGDDPEKYDNERTPKAQLACGSCPVRDDCLTAAMEAEGTSGVDMRSGIFGGLTSRQRAALARRQGNGPRPQTGGRPLARCGTESAYNRHVRNREPIDDACRSAHSKYERDRRSAGARAAR